MNFDMRDYKVEKYKGVTFIFTVPNSWDGAINIGDTTIISREVTKRIEEFKENLGEGIAEEILVREDVPPLVPIYKPFVWLDISQGKIGPEELAEIEGISTEEGGTFRQFIAMGLYGMGS